jgi:hypothetical protein
MSGNVEGNVKIQLIMYFIFLLPRLSHQSTEKNTLMINDFEAWKHIENGDVDFQIMTYLMQVHSLSLIVGLDVD